MSSICRAPWWVVPFLHFGTLRNILIPDVGHNIPFTVENFPYRDPFGRETVTFVLDYLGTHQHLAVALDLRVDGNGAFISRLASSGSTRANSPANFRKPVMHRPASNPFDMSNARF